MVIALALLLLVACSLGFLFFSKQIVIWYNKSLAEITAKEEALSTEYKELKKRKNSLKSEIQNIEQKIFLLKNEWIEASEETPTHHKSTKSSEEDVSRWLLSSGRITMEQHQKAQKLTGKVAQDFVETCIVLDFLDEKTITEARRIMRTGQLPPREIKAPK